MVVTAGCRHSLLMHHRLAIAFLFLLACSLTAQLANQPPLPQWLKGEETFEKTFTHQGKLLKAVLLGACDAEVEVQLNDQPAGKFSKSDQATSMDVTRFIREGDNRLQLKVKGLRVAVLLELNGDLANTTWLVSDASWKDSSGPVKTEVIDSAANPFDFKKTFDAYNSWQLAKPGAQALATDPSTLTLLPGFKAELIRSSSGDEGSWVSLAFDPQGRITLGREKRGLLRLDLTAQKIEVIDDTLLECRGLLYAHGALYANANNSKGLYRLRDTNGDDRFDESTELLHTEGGVGHGRNHLKLGPEGDLYLAHGNNVLLPTNVSTTSPLQHYANDQLLPNPWDGSMFDGNVELPAGYILRVKPDGSEVQLMAGGLRNPLDIAFNREGELFTFDADMERDVGAHWYMPTRVLHVVPGADFGWRRGTGRYPAYYPDTLPSVIDIGMSSPTAIFFGYGAKFPAKYQDALYLFDWSYGRIIAVHLKPKGASYTGEQETFISGRPLNVTDGCIGPDGALWFTTGGRGTQSGLYRVSYFGSESVAAAKGKPRPAYDGEDFNDAFVRHAQRMKLENNKVASTSVESGDVRVSTEVEATWSADAPLGWKALTDCLAGVRSKDSKLQVLAMRVAREHLASSTTDQLLASLRVLGVGLARGYLLEATERQELMRLLDRCWESSDHRVRWELTKLLIFLKSPTIIGRTTDYLKAATTSEDLLFYPMHLRYLRGGWTVEQRRVVFEALNRAEKLNGASSYFKAIADTRAELAAALTSDEATQLASVIHIAKPVALSPHAMPGHSFKAWKLADLEPMLSKVASGRSYEKAKAALVSTQCVFCHRVSADNTLPAGIVGPDLTQVSARFGRRDLLMHIVEPSVVIDEKFRSTIVTKVDGQQVMGTLEGEDDERVILKPNALSPEVIEIGKSMIQKRMISEVSPMPPGLLNTLKAEQILDLLAWFEASGDAKAKVWGKE